jgi:flagellar motor switch protein FliN/FliY
MPEPVVKPTSAVQSEAADERLAPDNPLLDAVSLRLSIELGSARMPLRDVLAMDEGVVVTLDTEAGAPLEVLVNGVRLGRGELVKTGSRYGIRMVELLPAEARVQPHLDTNGRRHG